MELQAPLLLKSGPECGRSSLVLVKVPLITVHYDVSTIDTRRQLNDVTGNISSTIPIVAISTENIKYYIEYLKHQHAMNIDPKSSCETPLPTLQHKPRINPKLKPGVETQIQAFLGLERVRTDVNVSPLAQPLLLHENSIFVVDAGTAADDFYSCDPLPKAWVQISRLVGRH